MKVWVCDMNQYYELDNPGKVFDIRIIKPHLYFIRGEKNTMVYTAEDCERVLANENCQAWLYNNPQLTENGNLRYQLCHEYKVYKKPQVVDWCAKFGE